ncbi:uncharacterized protein LOC133033669 [Cannabis sativa]|uniref:uncharacterized protein LOC133033669 n=1 Tax=Cannabis sativa TaxID=3483 RepID=UPI0029CAA24C|nr:uncharacterized protein LOC133033669 [Cannabis sativa]
MHALCFPSSTQTGFLVHPNRYCGGIWFLFWGSNPHHFFFHFINYSINGPDNYYLQNLSSDQIFLSIHYLLASRFTLRLHLHLLSSIFFYKASHYQIIRYLLIPFSFIKMAAKRIERLDDAWENRIIMMSTQVRGQAMTRGKPRALPSLILNSCQASPASVVETPLPDSQVRGKGLACASGVKRPTFQACQASVGGSMRSMLKRARAGDVDVTGSSSIPQDEQAGDAEHTRPEK